MFSEASLCELFASYGGILCGSLRAISFLTFSVSRDANAMFPLQKHQSTTPSVESIASEKPVLSVESASLIDYAENLRERFGLSIFRQQLDTGLETQQLDNSEREAMMDRIKSTINDYDNKHPHTGPTHIYLLDGRGLGNADDGVVNALISSSLRNPSHTLAALIPENTSYASPDDLSPSSMLKQLANRVLASEGVRCVVGKRALEAFLDGDEQYVVVGKGVSTESDSAVTGEKKND